MGNPSYLVRQPSSYCFRMVVPSDLQELVGKRELRYSLRTGFLSEAKYRARRMAGFTQGLFKRLRRQGTMAELSDADIKKLLADHLQEMLREAELDRTSKDKPMSRDDLDDYDEMLSLWQAEAREALATNNYKIMSVPRRVNELLAEKGIKVDPDSISYRKICRELLKADVQYFQVEQARACGDYSKEEQLPLSTTAVTTETQEEPPELLSTVIERYVSEREAAGTWGREKTKETFLSCVKLLIEVIGDVPIRSIDRKVMSKYKAALQGLPSNMKKVKKFRDKTVAQLLDMEIEKALRMHPNTVRKYFGWAGTLFKWAVLNGYLDRNPAEEMNLPKPKESSRNPFNKDDLNSLFRSEEYLNDSHEEPHRFWLPILGLFTGCRLNELCQLRLDDIREVDGVWVFDINETSAVEGEGGEEREEGEGKGLKTGSSARLIPLHPLLEKDLRFVQYVESLRSKGETRLFPELKYQYETYAHYASKWFNNIYRIKCGIKKDSGKVFHSFRHTFSNALKQAGVNLAMIAELDGHAAGTMTDWYTHKFPPKERLESAMVKLKYKVDLSHLKGSRFVKGVR